MLRGARHVKRCSCCERVEDVDAHSAHIGAIPSDEGEAVGSCSGCKQAIDDGKGSNGVHSSPLIGHLLVNVQNAVTKPGDNLFQPSLQSLCFLRVAPPCKFNAPADFTENQRTGPKFIVLNLVPPCGDRWIASGTLTQFGYDVCVDEVTQRSSSRPKSLGRSRSMSSRGAEARRSLKLLEGERVMWLCKITRVALCRAGSPSALAISRTKLASSLRTLTSTRTKPSVAWLLRHWVVLDRRAMAWLSLAGNCYRKPQVLQQICRDVCQPFLMHRDNFRRDIGRRDRSGPVG